MDLFESPVPSEAALMARDQRRGEQREESRGTEMLAKGSRSCEDSLAAQAQRLGGDLEETRTECVAMDLISRQPEYPDDRPESHDSHDV